MSKATAYLKAELAKHGIADAEIHVNTFKGTESVVAKKDGRVVGLHVGSVVFLDVPRRK